MRQFVKNIYNFITNREEHSEWQEQAMAAIEDSDPNVALDNLAEVSNDFATGIQGRNKSYRLASLGLGAIVLALGIGTGAYKLATSEDTAPTVKVETPKTEHPTNLPYWGIAKVNNNWVPLSQVGDSTPTEYAIRFDTRGVLGMPGGSTEFRDVLIESRDPTHLIDLVSRAMQASQKLDYYNNNTPNDRRGNPRGQTYLPEQFLLVAEYIAGEQFGGGHPAVRISEDDFEHAIADLDEKGYFTLQSPITPTPINGHNYMFTTDTDPTWRNGYSNISAANTLTAEDRKRKDWTIRVVGSPRTFELVKLDNGHNSSDNLRIRLENALSTQLASDIRHRRVLSQNYSASLANELFTRLAKRNGNQSKIYATDVETIEGIADVTTRTLSDLGVYYPSTHRTSW